METIIVAEDESSIVDADTLGTILQIVPRHDGVIDMEEVYQLCVKQLYPDASDRDNLELFERREVFKLFADIFFHYEFCQPKPFKWTFKNKPVSRRETDRMFITIFVPPRYLYDKDSPDAS